MKSIKYIIISILLSGLLFSSCDDMLDIKPENQLEKDEALKTKADLQALLNASYGNLQGCLGGRFQRYSELLTDNVIPINETDKRTNIYNRATTPYFTANEFYKQAYEAIMRANTVIDNINTPNDITDAEKAQMIKEAKFIRALCHFTVVRMFAQPYGYTSDNTHLGIVIETSSEVEFKSRATVAEVYKQIIDDLNDAIDLPAENDIYATSWGVKALLADVYFQMADYDNAFIHANDVITNSGIAFATEIQWKSVQETDEDNTFTVINNTESLVRMASKFGINNAGGDYGVYNGDNPKIMPSEVLTTLSMDANDKRSAWYKKMNEGKENEFIKFNKFESNIINAPIYTITQIKFIRAESALLKKDIKSEIAKQDITDIVTRAYTTTPTIPAGNPDILALIRSEKRLEFAGEGIWLHDQKRIGATENKDLKIRGVKWSYLGMILQFPSSEQNAKFVYNPMP